MHSTIHAIQGRQTPGLRALATALLPALFTALLAACGGGGGSSSTPTPTPVTPPYIAASVVAFPAGAIPAGFFATSGNAGIQVTVLASSTSATAVTTATVTASVNGGPALNLPYVTTYSDYEVETTVNPGDTVVLSVTIGSTTYTATGVENATYPTFIAPVSTANWSVASAQTISWNAVAGLASGTATYELGIMSTATATAGALVWPTTGKFSQIPTANTSYTLPAASLVASSTDDVLVAIGLQFPFSPNADPTSYFVTTGFNYASIVTIP